MLRVLKDGAEGCYVSSLCEAEGCAELRYERVQEAKSPLIDACQSQGEDLQDSIQAKNDELFL